MPQCPLGYLMFRMIFYTYLHLPELEMRLPKQVLIERYALTDHWDTYAAYEEAFIDRTRCRSRYRFFWDLARKL